MIVDAVEYYDKPPEKEVGFFFPDAEKAFDNINWDFLIAIMKKMQFGEHIINAIKAIYSDQQAGNTCEHGLNREF